MKFNRGSSGSNRIGSIEYFTYPFVKALPYSSTVKSGLHVGAAFTVTPF